MSGSGAEFEELLTQTRQVLSGAAGDSAAKSGHPAEPAGPVTGEGFDADRLVRVLVADGGRVAAVEVADRALRLGSAEISDRAVVAVNAALDDFEAKTLRLGGLAGVDPEQLSRLQDSAAAQLSGLVTGLADLMKSFGR